MTKSFNHVLLLLLIYKVVLPCRKKIHDAPFPLLQLQEQAPCNNAYNFSTPNLNY